jgi:hypothetical protein
MPWRQPASVHRRERRRSRCASSKARKGKIWEINQRLMSGLPPVERRFWSPIVIVFCGNWSTPSHSQRDSVGRTTVRRLPAGLDDTSDLGWPGAACTQTGHENRRTSEPSAARSSGSMIYLDSSVALAHLLAEDRFPPDLLWDQQLVSSRLLECEVWNRSTRTSSKIRMAMRCVI